jgi:OOP family OmpA-OmpF porin
MTFQRTHLAAALAAALLLPTFASAQSTTGSTATVARTATNADWFDNRWYVTPMVGYTWADTMRHADNGITGGVAIGKPINSYLNIELRALYEQLDSVVGGPGDYKNWTVGLDAQWFPLGRQGYDRRHGFQPYLVAGVGGINDKNSLKDEFSVMANVGAGVVWAFSDWGRIVADVRYRWDDNRGKVNRGRDNDFGDWVATIGLQIPFGAAPAMPRAVVAAPVAAPVVAPPPARPTPVPAPAVVAPAPLVPAPVPVPAPAPQPVTRSVEVSADGMFAFDSAQLSADGRSRIEKAVNGLRAQGVDNVTAVKIVGHTDPIGTAEYNQRLSEQRANAVKSYLSTLGIPAGIITASGAGESQPKITEADCRAKGAKSQSQMAACLAPDRRVEVSVTGTGKANR